jgi:hypothetical protein
MRALLALVPVTLFALASCGSGNPNPSAAGDPGDATTSNAPVLSCHPTCGTATDCGVPGDPLYDPSHFACQGGKCQWLGCRAASECATEAHGGTFLCQSEGGGAPPACIPSCQAASDCVPPGNTSTLQDVHHFACNGGVCVWLGCASTGECSAALHTTKVACDRSGGGPTPACEPTCATAADCAQQGGGLLGDKNHYACRAGRCQWLGCKSSTECTQALASSRYVCD